MSDLDDLAEIAEANAFGFGGLAINGAPRQGHRPSNGTCGSGHPMTEENTRRYRDKRGRIRRVCRACDKARATCRRNARRMRAASEGS
jgi:hypothetical protein